jgi:hypothetical protein
VLTVEFVFDRILASLNFTKFETEGESNVP